MWPILGAIAVLAAGAQTSPAASDDSSSRGLYVALRVCSACHKVALPGVGPDSAAPSFAAIHARHDAAGLHGLLVEIAGAGHHQMPPIPMSPREIEDVAAYIATVPPPPPGSGPAPKVGQHSPHAPLLVPGRSTRRIS
jgi:mono/diheme cytochrome c family protein